MILEKTPIHPLQQCPVLEQVHPLASAKPPLGLGPEKSGGFGWNISADDTLMGCGSERLLNAKRGVSDGREDVRSLHPYQMPEPREPRGNTWTSTDSEMGVGQPAGMVLGVGQDVRFKKLMSLGPAIRL